MSDEHSDQIRQRAYQIWQAEGEPDGRDQEHWAQAEREHGKGVFEDHAAEAGDGEDASRPSDSDRAT